MEHLMHKGDGNRALPNRRRHPLDIAAPDIADRMVLSRAISEGLPKIQETTCRGDHKTPNSLPPWDLTAGQLIGADHALALARLRMDIERELRRIALETQIDLSLRSVGIKALARELVSKEVLPVTLMDPWRKWRKSVTLRFMGEKSPMMSPPQLSESGDSYWSSCACCQSSHSKLSVTFKM
jgi:hypothetical protein